MSGNFLKSLFGSVTEVKSDARKAAGKLKGMTTYLSDAVDALKGTTVAEALHESLPWADAKLWSEAVGAGLKEALPVVKFAFTILDKLTETPDANDCGLLACTLAYQRSVEQAVRATTVVPEAPEEAKEELKKVLRELDHDEQKVDFATFSLETPSEHVFLKRAEKMFDRYLAGVGYGERPRRVLVMSARRNFVATLRLVLSHGKLQKHFKPFLDLIQLAQGAGSMEVIMRHVQYQRWRFEHEPVLGEPFALQHVYIETECGVLKWGEIRDGGGHEHTQGGGGEGQAGRTNKMDPFAEQNGGRHGLLETVMSLMKDKNFSDAIVVQGAAGTGKSSFTLKLCSELEREGLYPLRICLRDLAQSMNISLQ